MSGEVVSRTFVGVYWRARQADLPSCAELALRHFQALSDASPHLAHWFLRANRKPVRPIEVDVRSHAALEQMLAKGVNRRDLDRQPIPELGWSIGYWSAGAGGWSATSDVHCGMFSKVRGLSNRATLSIVGDVPDDLATGILRAMIGIWNADWGVARREDAGGDMEITLGDYRTSFFARLFRRGERFARGRLLIG